MPEDRERCHAIFLNFHEIAIEILGHTILPAKPNTLSELYAAVIRRLIVQQTIFPQAFAAYTIQHEKHNQYRHEIIKQLRLQQKPDDRDIFLQSLKTIQLPNIGKTGSRFPEKHTWLFENSEGYYNLWRDHFNSKQLYDRRVSRKPTIHNIDSQQWVYIVDSKESIRVVDQESGKIFLILLQ